MKQTCNFDKIRRTGNSRMQQMANNDESFINACGLAGVEPTAHQAGKFTRKVGLAYSKK